MDRRDFIRTSAMFGAGFPLLGRGDTKGVQVEFLDDLLEKVHLDTSTGP